MDCSIPGFRVLHYLLEFAQTYVPWVGDTIQSSQPLAPPSPLAVSLSQHQGFFSKESALCIRWPKYWSFSFSISPSSEYSGFISFRIDWFELHAVQGILKSLLQCHSFKALILQHIAFFYGPTLTSIHDYSKNYSFDYMDFCQQSDVSAFQYAV